MTSTSMLSAALTTLLSTLLQVPANAAEAPASPGSSARAPVSELPDSAPPAATKVNINTAGAKELMQVLKIDDKTAQLIVKNRKDGKYESADDLVIRGVFSNKELKSIKDKITVGSPGK